MSHGATCFSWIHWATRQPPPITCIHVTFNLAFLKFYLNFELIKLHTVRIVHCVTHFILLTMHFVRNDKSDDTKLKIQVLHWLLHSYSVGNNENWLFDNQLEFLILLLSLKITLVAIIFQGFCFVTLRFCRNKCLN